MSRPNGEENSSSEEVGQRQEVSGNNPVPLQNSPEKGGETERQMPTTRTLSSQQTVRRSSRIVRKAVRSGDFVLSLRS